MSSKLSGEMIKYGSPEKGALNSIDAGNLKILIKVTAQAKTLAPVNMGALKNSIMWKIHNKTGGFNGGTPLTYNPKIGGGVVGSAMEYAGYQEFGTRKMRARPYLRPAIAMEAMGQTALQALKQSCIYEMTQALKNGKSYKWKF